MSSAFGPPALPGAPGGAPVSTDSSDSTNTTNTAQNAWLTAGVNNAANATGSNSGAPSSASTTPTATIPLPAGISTPSYLPAPVAPSSAPPPAWASQTTGSYNAVTGTYSGAQVSPTGGSANGAGLPTASYGVGANSLQYADQAIQFYNTYGYLPPPPSGAPQAEVNAEDQFITQMIQSKSPYAAVSTYADYAAASSAVAASQWAAYSTAVAQSLAVAAQIASDAVAASTLSAGFLNAGGSSSNTAAAAQQNAELFRNTMGAAHQGGVWGQQAAKDSIGGNAAIAAGNTQLGQAQDTVNNAQSQMQYLATTIQNDMANHSLDAATAINNMNNVIQQITNELSNAQGADALALKQQLNNITQAINNLQGSTAASQLGSSEFWGTFGTIASAAAKVAPAVALAF